MCVCTRVTFSSLIFTRAPPCLRVTCPLPLTGSTRPSVYRLLATKPITPHHISSSHPQLTNGIKPTTPTPLQAGVLRVSVEAELAGLDMTGRGKSTSGGLQGRGGRGPRARRAFWWGLIVMSAERVRRCPVPFMGAMIHMIWGASER